MAKVRLFTTIYSESSVKRREEYRKCLELNSACNQIDEIHVLCEGGKELLPKSHKIRVREVQQRPVYQQYLDWISEVADQESDLSIIANTDIYFDKQLALFRSWEMPKYTVFALSRWDVVARGQYVLHDKGDSQDAWLLRGIPLRVNGNFPIGVPRCDNRIAAEFERAGYRVLNPSYSLRCYHIHDEAPRPYLEPDHSELIPPPYKYVYPQNLLDPVETFLHNLRNPDARLFWQIDRRKLLQWAPTTVLRKSLGRFKRKH